MKNRKERHVSAEELRTLLQSPEWVRDDMRLRQLLDAKQDTGFKTFEAIYVHRATRDILLEYEYGWGLLFPTAKFTKFFVRISRHVPFRAMHVLEDIFPYDSGFPLLIEKFVPVLVEPLELPPDALDFSLHSLEAFDQPLLERDQDDNLAVPMFPALVAYCGEVLRRLMDGQWEMRRSKEFPDIWEPWIVPPNQLGIDVGLAVFTSLHEDIPQSIYARIAVEFEMWERRSRPR